MAATVNHGFSNLSSIRLNHAKTKRWTGPRRRRLTAGPIRCKVSAEENRRITVRYGDDSLEICRILNGMRQTSGGWGRIDRDSTVETMLRYADAGLSAFDMADICKPT